MKKAISPLIAGVILIAFTIVAAIIVTSALTSITKQQTESITIKQQCPLASLEILSTSCKITNITEKQENWWNSSWNYRQPITIQENYNQNLNNSMIIVTMDTSSLISTGKMQDDCGDIRLYDIATNSTIDYDINDCNATNTGIVFKKSLTTGETNIDVYLYYGNPTVVNANLLNYYVNQTYDLSSLEYDQVTLSSEVFGPDGTGGSGSLDDLNDEYDIVGEADKNRGELINDTEAYMNFEVIWHYNSYSTGAYVSAVYGFVFQSLTNDDNATYLQRHNDGWNKFRKRVNDVVTDLSSDAGSPTGWWKVVKNDTFWTVNYSSNGVDYSIYWNGTISDYENDSMWYIGVGGISGAGHISTDFIDIKPVQGVNAPTTSLKTEQNQANITQSYQLTTTIFNPSQIELTNITATAVIGNQTFSQQTPYSIQSGQYLTIQTNASSGIIEKIRISALNCPVYIEALNVGKCE